MALARSFCDWVNEPVVVRRAWKAGRRTSSATPALDSSSEIYLLIAGLAKEIPKLFTAPESAGLV